MRQQGLRGVVRGKFVPATFDPPTALCPQDRGKRQSKAGRATLL